MGDSHATPRTARHVRRRGRRCHGRLDLGEPDGSARLARHRTGPARVQVRVGLGHLGHRAARPHGAQLLWNHWGRRWPEQLEAAPAQRAVLAHVAEFTVAAPPEPAHTLGSYLLSMGGRLFALREHLRDLVRLIGQLFIDLGRLIAAPHQGPWRDVSGHLFHIGATAMPITALVGFPHRRWCCWSHSAAIAPVRR